MKNAIPDMALLDYFVPFAVILLLFIVVLVVLSKVDSFLGISADKTEARREKREKEEKER